MPIFPRLSIPIGCLLVVLLGYTLSRVMKDMVASSTFFSHGPGGIDS